MVIRDVVEAAKLHKAFVDIHQGHVAH
jgi:hypothetical protein